MIELKRILFPNRDIERFSNSRKATELEVREMKLGKNLDTLGHLPELIRRQHARKVRRVKRHRELSKSSTGGEQKCGQTEMRQVEVTTLPSRCIKRVMDSLASLGQVGRLQKQLTISSGPAGWRAVHQPKPRPKRRRSGGLGVHKKTKRYMKGLKRTKKLGKVETSVSAESLSTLNSGNGGNKKSSTSTNAVLSTGLSAMFGIIAPLYSRSKKDANNSRIVQHTNSRCNENSSAAMEVSTSSSLQSLGSKVSGTAKGIDSEVPSETGLPLVANAEVIQATALNEGQPTEKATKPRRRKASSEGREHKPQESLDNKIHEPRTVKRRSNRRHNTAIDACVRLTSEDIEWNDPSSMIDRPNSQKQVPTGSEIAKPERSVCQSSSDDKPNEFPLRRSKRIQSTQTLDCSHDSAISMSSTFVTAKERTTTFLDDSSTQQKSTNVSTTNTTMMGKPGKRQRELEESRPLLRRSTRQILAPDRLCDSVLAPVTGRTTKRKRSDAIDPLEDGPTSARGEGRDATGENSRIEDVSRKDPDSWTDMEIVLLRKSHQEANPKSITFWDDIAACVGSKSATECRDRWFSFVKTPAPHLRKGKASAVQAVPQLVDDDIFNATPMRSLFQKAELGFRLDGSDWGGLLGTGSAIKVATEEHPNDKSPSLPSIKHGYKTYIKNVKRYVNESSKCKLPAGKKQKKNNRAFSLQDCEGDFEVNGRLSPGGTLRVNTHVNELDDLDIENEDEL